MLPLRPGALPDVDVRNIIFITRPNLKLMNCIADNVHSIDKRHKSAASKEIFLYFLPRISTLCETQLKNKGVYGSFTHVGEFKCDFFPVDNDLLSMELKDTYRYVSFQESIIFSERKMLYRMEGRIIVSWLQGVVYWRWSNQHISIGQSADCTAETLRSHTKNLWQRQ